MRQLNAAALLLFVVLACDSSTLKKTHPAISVTPAALDFGMVGMFSPASKQLTITNVGSSPLTVQSMSVTEDSAHAFTVQGAPASISVGSSAQITVVFTPPHEAGLYGASLTITSNADNAPQLLVQLSARVNPDCDALECGGGSECRMVGGVAECACRAGYQSNGETGSAMTCKDINECETDNGGCGDEPGTVCTNTIGSHTCDCANGYRKDEGNKCQPVNACLTENGGCDVNATCTSTGPGTVSCECKPGYTGDGKAGNCAASCALPWGGTIESGKSVAAFASASVACNSSCMPETLTCTNGALSGTAQYQTCSVASCGGDCPATTVHFDWGTTAGGPCTIDLPAGQSSTWYYTAKTDANVGGFFADCNTSTGQWAFSGAHCVPRGSSTTCFVTGTRCDGAGPAVFPFPHCWACCNATDAFPGTCN